MKRLFPILFILALAACGEAPTAVEDTAGLELATSFGHAFDFNPDPYPNDVTYGMLHGTVRFWNTAVTGVSDGTFSGNQAIVKPGASVTMTGSWQIGPVTNTSYCPGCIIQIYVAWVPDAAANGATPRNKGLWSGQTYYTNPNPGASGSFNWTTQAPTVPGTYYVGRGQTLHYSFQWYAQGGFGWPTGGDPADQVASYVINVVGDPATKNECKKGGWEAFGFVNQGQCVRFVETGKDSRFP
jgi:hypothetical protein